MGASMTPIVDFFRRVSRAVAVAGLVILILFAALTVADALIRSFGFSLDFVRDSGSLVTALAGACCLPIVVIERGNITLRLFSGARWGRIGPAVELAAEMIVFAILFGMAFQFVRFALNSLRAGEATWMLAIPHWPFYGAIAAVFCLCVAQQGALIAASVVRMTARDDAA